MKKESWENEFLQMMDNKLPDQPRHIKLALVERVDPLEINVGGLLFERSKGEVVLNETLVVHEEKDITLHSKAWQYPVQCDKVSHNKIALQAGDRVAYVPLEGNQQILVLCKVVS